MASCPALRQTLDTIPKGPCILADWLDATTNQPRIRTLLSLAVHAAHFDHPSSQPSHGLAKEFALRWPCCPLLLPSLHRPLPRKTSWHHTVQWPRELQRYRAANALRGRFATAPGHLASARDHGVPPHRALLFPAAVRHPAAWQPMLRYALPSWPVMPPVPRDRARTSNGAAWSRAEATRPAAAIIATPLVTHRVAGLSFLFSPAVPSLQST